MDRSFTLNGSGHGNDIPGIGRESFPLPKCHAHAHWHSRGNVTVSENSRLRCRRLPHYTERLCFCIGTKTKVAAHALCIGLLFGDLGNNFMHHQFITDCVRRFCMGCIFTGYKVIVKSASKLDEREW